MVRFKTNGGRTGRLRKTDFAVAGIFPIPHTFMEGRRETRCVAW
jgi:hypothetical protein